METLAKRWSVSETKTRNVVVTLSERQNPKIDVRLQARRGIARSFLGRYDFQWDCTVSSCVVEIAREALHERLCYCRASRRSRSGSWNPRSRRNPGIVLGGITEKFNCWTNRELAAVSRQNRNCWTGRWIRPERAFFSYRSGAERGERRPCFGGHMESLRE